MPGARVIRLRKVSYVLYRVHGADRAAECQAGVDLELESRWSLCSDWVCCPKEDQSRRNCECAFHTSEVKQRTVLINEKIFGLSRQGVNVVFLRFRWF